MPMVMRPFLNNSLEFIKKVDNHFCTKEIRWSFSHPTLACLEEKERKKAYVCLWWQKYEPKHPTDAMLSEWLQCIVQEDQFFSEK